MGRTRTTKRRMAQALSTRRYRLAHEKRSRHVEKQARRRPLAPEIHGSDNNRRLNRTSASRVYGLVSDATQDSTQACREMRRKRSTGITHSMWKVRTIDMITAGYLETHTKNCGTRPKAATRKQLRQAAVTVDLKGKPPPVGSFLKPAEYTTIAKTTECSNKCPYCHQFHAGTPNAKFTPTQCRACPFDHWLAHVIHRRSNVPAKTTETQRNLWNFRCGSCGHMFATMKGMVAHRNGCEHRRIAAGIAASPCPPQ